MRKLVLSCLIGCLMSSTAFSQMAIREVSPYPGIQDQNTAPAFVTSDVAGPTHIGCSRSDADVEFKAGGCKKGTTLSCYNCIKTACSSGCETHCQDICDGQLFARLAMEELLEFFSADELTINAISSGHFEDDEHLTFDDVDLIAALAFRAQGDQAERWARALASDRLVAVANGDVTADGDAVLLLQRTVADGMHSTHWKTRFATYKLLVESGVGENDIQFMGDMINQLIVETNEKVRERGIEYLSLVYTGG